MSAVCASPAPGVERRLDAVRALQHALYRAAKADPGRRFHALYDKVHRRDVLQRAWSQVRRNDGAPGIDQITLAEVEEYGVCPAARRVGSGAAGADVPSDPGPAGIHTEAGDQGAEAVVDSDGGGIVPRRPVTIWVSLSSLIRSTR